MTPLAEAISSAPSVEKIALSPTTRSSNGSQTPNDAEITCGFCRTRSGAVIPFSRSDALPFVSNTLIEDNPGAAASSTSRSSVDSPPGASNFEIPTPNVVMAGIGRPKQLANAARSEYL